MISTALLILAADEGAGGLAVMGGMCVCYLIIFVIFGIIPMIGMWKAFDKAGEPGVAAIVPIWNLLVLAKISGRDPVMGLVCLIPCVGIIFMIIFMMDIAKRFGKEAIFGLGLAFLGFIFWPLLGFGSAQYVGDRGGSRRDDY
jgi:hypothetical protein